MDIQKVQTELDPQSRSFTLTHKGDLMIDTAPDTGEPYFLTFAEAVWELGDVRRNKGEDFIASDWGIVAIAPVGFHNITVMTGGAA